ncbi:MAG: indole-3-glycerol-phosphate synthase [Candidatus Saliniplasma sp.]
MDIKEELGEVVGGIIKQKMKDSINSKKKLYRSLKEDDHVDIIPEIKPSSPDQKGTSDIDLEWIQNLSKVYEEEGGKGISVHTEQYYFDGQLEYITTVKENTSIPVLAKGFFFDTRHLVECKHHGADSFLLLTKVLNTFNRDIYEFIKTGESLGLEPFVEASSRSELKKALKIHPKIIEINNRDIYGDLSIDLEKAKMCRYIPEDIAVVSASGVESGDDIKRLHKLSNGRIDAVLVGTSIMKADSPREKMKELVEAGRELP